MSNKEYYKLIYYSFHKKREVIFKHLKTVHRFIKRLVKYNVGTPYELFKNDKLVYSDSLNNNPYNFNKDIFYQEWS